MVIDLTSTRQFTPKRENLHGKSTGSLLFRPTGTWKPWRKPSPRVHGRLRPSVDIKRVPETAPLEVAKAAHSNWIRVRRWRPIDDLANYDAIVVGTPRASASVFFADGEFPDQAGGLWIARRAARQSRGAFTSTATQHGGQEMTFVSIITNLLHFGMTIVGPAVQSPGGR